jgi:hypothetical protein
MAKHRVTTLFASAQRLAASSPFTSAIAQTHVGATKPLTDTTESLCGAALVHIHVSSVSGTLDPVVSGSTDGGTTYFTIAPTSAWASITTTGDTVRTLAGPLPPLLKVTATVAGTVTFSSDVMLTDVM